MSPSVSIAGTGLAGWTFLQATTERQMNGIRDNALVARKIEYFAKNIGNIDSAEALVADRRLLDVALTAFGLQEDLPNKAFIRKVLAEGTTDDKSFANRLSDRRYGELAKAFSFDLTPPNTVLSTFADKIADRFLRQTFEIAAGDLDPDMRLALAFERDFPELAATTSSKDAFWFTVIGTPPVRRIFESALGIPAAASGISVDRQLEEFKSKAERVYGTSEPAKLVELGPDRIIRDFLLRSQVSAFETTAIRGSVALSLLQTSLPPVS